jgi:hypothetical protein
MEEWRFSSTFLDIGFTHLPLYLGGKRPGNHWIGGWLNSRVGLDPVEKRKSSIAGNRTRDVLLVSIPTELSRLLLS